MTRVQGGGGGRHEYAEMGQAFRKLFDSLFGNKEMRVSGMHNVEQTMK